MNMEEQVKSQESLKCFVCREPLSSANCFLEDGHPESRTFDSLCQLFRIPAFEKPPDDGSFNRVANAEFCITCSLQIVDAMMMYNQIKNLEERVNEIKNSLRQNIVSSFQQAQNEQSGGLLSRTSSSVLRKYVAQSKPFWHNIACEYDHGNLLTMYCLFLALSPCEVALSPLPDHMIPKTQPTRECRPVSFRALAGVDVDSDVEFDEGIRSGFDENDPEYNENVKEDVVDSRDQKKPRLRKRMKAKKSKKVVKDTITRGRPKQKPGEYACKLCEEIFETRKLLEAHTSESHGESLLPSCIYCETEFSAECLPNGEPEEKPYKCRMDGCRLAYKTLSELRKHHMKKCTESPTVKKKPTTYPCDRCDKVYATEVAFLNHVRGFHEQKFKCVCDHCGKGFQAVSTMERHIAMAHSKEKPFKCELCSLTFKQKVQLVHHKRRHTGELPFQCDICGKAFHSKQRARQHMQNVHSDMQVPCPLCGKIFRSKDYVSKHIYDTHEGKRKNRGHTKRQETTDGASDYPQALQHYFPEDLSVIAEFTVPAVTMESDQDDGSADGQKVDDEHYSQVNAKINVDNL